MFKKSLQTITVAAAVVTASGCAAVASPVGQGALFTSVQGPVTATPNSAVSKVGESCASNVLGLFATGDASIEQARRNGGINEVSTIDHHSTSVLFIYSKFCTVVRGQ